MSEFWAGRRVLLTGHTGFKGAWLASTLADRGAEVVGLAHEPDPRGAAFDLLGIEGRVASRVGDIRNPDAMADAVRAARPEVVFHLAAQALVPASLADPVGTFDVNVVGTANVLRHAAAAPETRAVVVVTSDKVYANDESGRAFVESDRLGGGDPYSASKAGTELVCASWRHSFGRADGPAIVTARAGNVIGGGDRSANRLLPDLLRAIESDEPLVVRRPEAVRPWQHVLEPVAGYVRYAEAAWAAADAGGNGSLPTALNFGPGPESERPVREVVERTLALCGRGAWRVEGSEDGGREAGLLRLDASAAEATLGWKPAVDLDTALRWTVEWWQAEWADPASVAAVAAEQRAAQAAAGGAST